MLVSLSLILKLPLSLSLNSSLFCLSLFTLSVLFIHPPNILLLSVPSLSPHYRIARIFRWCKILQSCFPALQKKISWFLLWYGTLARSHPPIVHNFMVLIFTVAELSMKTAKFSTMQKFPTIWYLYNLTLSPCMHF